MVPIENREEAAWCGACSLVSPGHSAGVRVVHAKMGHGHSFTDKAVFCRFTAGSFLQRSSRPLLLCDGALEEFEVAGA